METNNIPPDENGNKPPVVTLPLEEVEKLEKEASEYKDKYLRLLAEQENVRKRLIKEQSDMIRQSTKHVIADFLTPIDQMESALKFASAMSEEVKHWAAGFEMILGHFREVLSSLNVREMTVLGKQYDPHLHHVTESIETTDASPGTIIKESLKGYMIGDQPLRPAHVVIAKAKSPTIQEKNALPEEEGEK